MRRLFFYLLLTTLLFSKEVDSSKKVKKFIDSAKAQIGVTLIYDPSYKRIKFPMGDIDKSRGVCTDVVVRALRGVGIDLQKEIYRPKKFNPKLYSRDSYPT